MHLKAQISTERWHIDGCLGQGTSSLVFQGIPYLGKDRTSGQLAAIKVPRTEVYRSNLQREAETLSLLAECASMSYLGVPKLVEYRCDEQYHYMAMEMVGKTLENLSHKKPFSPLTVAMLGVQLVTAVEALHAADFLHRDIKPDNLASASNADDSSVYLLDLGSACKYKICGCHVKYVEGVPFTGNYVFCSCNALKSVKSSCRDDMESLAYVLVYLRSGHLPWCKLNSDSPATRAKHWQRKLGLTPLQVCTGLETEYQQFLTYCRALNFEAKPNYQYLRELFQGLSLRLGFTGHWEYSWLHRPHRAKNSEGSIQRIATISPFREQPLEQSSNAHPSPLPSLPKSDFGGRSDKRKPRITVFKQKGEELATPIMPTLLNIDAVRRKLKVISAEHENS